MKSVGSMKRLYYVYHIIYMISYMLCVFNQLCLSMICVLFSSMIARFMGPTWGPSGATRTQVGPNPWTLLSGLICMQSEWCLRVVPRCTANGIEVVCFRAKIFCGVCILGWDSNTSSSKLTNNRVPYLPLLDGPRQVKLYIGQIQFRKNFIKNVKIWKFGKI